MGEISEAFIDGPQIVFDILELNVPNAQRILSLDGFLRCDLILKSVPN